MRRVLLFAPLLGVLVACQNTTIRLYTAQPMPGLTSPFTTNCTSIRVMAGNTDSTISQDDTSQGDKAYAITASPNPGPTSVSAQCLAIVDGKLTVMGSAQIQVTSKTLNVYIGSGEGSSDAAAFAKVSNISGIFPIIRAD